MKTDTRETNTGSKERHGREEEGNRGKGAASLLLTRPRRGQARKPRQRRDFQRDILPSIASLSRHEVTVDLQTIGGLMRASGRPWQMAVSRRRSKRIKSSS